MSKSTSLEPIDPAALAAVAEGAMSVTAAAEFTGENRNVLFALMKNGTLEWYYSGKNRRITRKSLHEYLARLYAAHNKTQSRQSSASG